MESLWDLEDLANEELHSTSQQQRVLDEESSEELQVEPPDATGEDTSEEESSHSLASSSAAFLLPDEANETLDGESAEDDSPQEEIMETNRFTLNGKKKGKATRPVLAEKKEQPAAAHTGKKRRDVPFRAYER